MRCLTCPCCARPPLATAATPASPQVLNSPPAWLLGLVAGLAAAGIALVAGAARSLVAAICKGRLLQASLSIGRGEGRAGQGRSAAHT